MMIGEVCFSCAVGVGASTSFATFEIIFLCVADAGAIHGRRGAARAQALGVDRAWVVREQPTCELPSACVFARATQAEHARRLALLAEHLRRKTPIELVEQAERERALATPHGALGTPQPAHGLEEVGAQRARLGLGYSASARRRGARRRSACGGSARRDAAGTACARCAIVHGRWRVAPRGTRRRRSRAVIRR